MGVNASGQREYATVFPLNSSSVFQRFQSPFAGAEARCTFVLSSRNTSPPVQKEFHSLEARPAAPIFVRMAP